MTELKKIAKGYTRVSTAKQATEGISLETQATRIREYCVYKKLELVKVYEDAGLSGKDIEGRPALQQLLNDIQPGDHLIFYDLSRLGRDTRDLLDIHDFLKEKKATMVCLNPDIDFSTSVGEMMMTVLASVATYERRETAERVSDNLRRLSAEGKLRSKAPFGWRFVAKDKDFEPVPEQQEIIKWCCEQYQNGHSVYKIANCLNQGGLGYVFNLNKLKPCKNPQFHGHVIKRILTDAGSIDDTKNRRPIENRIISHHKKVEVSS